MRVYYIKYILSLFVVTILFSCNDLDLEQQDAASSATWYQTKDQFRESVSEGYRREFWPIDKSGNGMSDDWMRRDALDAIKAGTIDSEDGRSLTRWSNLYKGITRMLVVKNQLESQTFLTMPDYEQFSGEVDFFLASYWSYLISHYGDVPFYEEEVSIEESYLISRTEKEEILQKIYIYYDNAFNKLQPSYNGLKYVTKGAAAAFKARIALYMGDFETAATAAKNCIDLNEYELYPNYDQLFLPSTKNSVETIFHLPRSADYNIVYSGLDVQDFLPRNRGGYGARNPTWELLASYLCTDGLPIDESPLFDSRNPFKNRDPRCAMTIVPFGSLEDGDGLLPSDGSLWLEREYTPHPEKKQILNFANNTQVRNNDTRSVAQFASFNGLIWKKGIDESWVDLETDQDEIIMRYADVLLMYAEAKIELNQIDASVIDAIHQVRARAYANSGTPYPQVTTTDQEELRLIVRTERRMELAFEGLRYMDLIRWKLADKVLTGNLIGMLNVSTNANADVQPTGPLMDVIVNPDLYFWPIVPEIDEDGLPDFSEFLELGYARSLNQISFPGRQYLWPIPAAERRINENLTQNEGY
ncbi:Starch-binding associating with outer membrane [Zhouia amylolytica]|uniref:Starch-binding associating with outer membrane n=1 Tax=Zhouia amylolytica TaxID=376730 RepID=A0A1I6V2Z7_9FLAO|nr:RagB/SusD family nutrient uptake outer membrane protein [Zhouia amylolytica]SFT08052.1 Starch-binding associating with outer membrane [Zhouia amylolytica]